MDKDGSFLSGETKAQEATSLAPWIVAAGVVLLIVAGLLFLGGHAKKAVTRNSVPDAYASQLAIGGITLSQSSNMAGSQITYVDGVIANHGSRVVDGVMVNTEFHLAAGSPLDGTDKQVQATSLNLIRTREPYVDIEPVGADPLKPGESKPFRLIFDRLSPEWDQQNPDVRVMQVHLR